MECFVGTVRKNVTAVNKDLDNIIVCLCPYSTKKSAGNANTLKLCVKNIYNNGHFIACKNCSWTHKSKSNSKMQGKKLQKINLSSNKLGKCSKYFYTYCVPAEYHTAEVGVIDNLLLEVKRVDKLGKVRLFSTPLNQL